MKKKYEGFTIFMNLDGLGFPRKKGLPSKHPGWFPVRSISLDNTSLRPGFIRGAGPSSNDDAVSVVNVGRPIDAGTPALQENMLKGALIRQAEFNVYRRAGKTLIRTMHLVLNNCTIGSWSTQVGRPGTKGTTTFDVTYQDLKVEQFV